MDIPWSLVYKMSLRRPINLRLDRVTFAFFGGVFGSKMTPNGLFGGTPGPHWVDLVQAISQGSRLHSRQSRYIWIALGPVYTRCRLGVQSVSDYVGYRVHSLGAFFGHK